MFFVLQSSDAQIIFDHPVPHSELQYGVFFCPHLYQFLYGKGKSKAIPLQDLTGPEGSRRLRIPDFKAIGT
jgi:hypothetical protein